MTTYTLTPIGRVSAKGGSFSLKLQKRYVPALRGLDGFSHVVVLWWCHGVDKEEYRGLTEFDRPYRKSPARIGVFATRSPARPNPIAATAVPVLEIDHESGVLEIPFIDAEDGSPLLDIKPYHPCTDRIKEVSVPAWCRHWPQWYEDSARFDWGAEFVTAE